MKKSKSKVEKKTKLNKARNIEKKKTTTNFLHKKVFKKLPYFSNLAFQAPELAHGRRGEGDTTP
jgi:hypothetical protein